MKLTVKLIGAFVTQFGFNEQEIEVPAETTPAKLIDILRIDKTRPKIITRNGCAVAPDEILKEGDRVVISPIYSGG